MSAFKIILIPSIFSSMPSISLLNLSVTLFTIIIFSSSNNDFVKNVSNIEFHFVKFHFQNI